MTTLDLLLWRHAEAEPGLHDMARALTPKGHRQARQMATWLKQHFPSDGRLLVSPAVRTQQTAQALAIPIEIEAGLAPGASPESVAEVVNRYWDAGASRLIVVGHQPTLGLFAGACLCAWPGFRDRPSRVQDVAGLDLGIKKGAVAWLRLEAGQTHCAAGTEAIALDVRSAYASLRAYMHPGLL